MGQAMRSSLHMITVITCLALALAACSPTAAPLSKQEAGEIAWRALEPNTSSHSLTAWEVAELRSVTGQEILDRFPGEPAAGGCVPGPIPSANTAIAPGGSYWYVVFKPGRATPLPQPTEQFSPTAPPLVPEPFVYEGRFLIDAVTGQIAARKLFCVIY